ncbi:response regulator transcription factor [Mucilaginibacter aquatilis]|uniref:Response regulator n=1 Tax=Mucilaginibacter aquatilis TaxID=1517760 RepID=A0A6I4IDA9_9SPHI|nr:response regulator transcription factor [Mucilaginibacter aquatilis]MVN93152.1 response regulator [Mucilaginibacter aquatilis]
MNKVRVAIADDHKIFGQSLGMLIQSVDEFELLFVAENGLDFLEKLKAAPHLPDVALLDIDMPFMNGIELNRQLHKSKPELKIIMLSVHLEEELITQVIDDGAASYLAKNCDKEDLIKAVRMVYSEGFYINQLTLRALTAAAKARNKSSKKLKPVHETLTERERAVLDLICKEFNNAEIAQILFISVRTVEGHRNNLLTKTSSRNTAGLVLFAIRHQLFEVPL